MKFSLRRMTFLSIVVIGIFLLVAGGGLLYLYYGGVSVSKNPESFAVGQFLGATGLLSLFLGILFVGFGRHFFLKNER